MVVENLDDPHLDPADIHHLGKVLRLRPGEALGATDGRGGLRRLVWRGGGSVEPGGEADRLPRAEPSLTVAFPPVKGDRPEWAVQKLTEIGVDRIVLMHAERSVVRWEGDRAGGHLERLRRVARSALMQSKGRWLPELSVDEFSSLVSGAGPGPAVAMALPGDPGKPSLAQPTVLVGPEGGWSAGEEQARGVAHIGLGPTVLRSETAAVAAAVLLCGLRSGLVGPA